MTEMPHHARGYRARFPFGTAADPAGGEVVTRTARYGAQRAGGDRGLSRACPFGFTLVSRDSNQYSLRRCAIHRHVRGAYRGNRGLNRDGRGTTHPPQWPGHPEPMCNDMNMRTNCVQSPGQRRRNIEVRR